MNLQFKKSNWLGITRWLVGLLQPLASGPASLINTQQTLRLQTRPAPSKFRFSELVLVKIWLGQCGLDRLWLHSHIEGNVALAFVPQRPRRWVRPIRSMLLGPIFGPLRIYPAPLSGLNVLLKVAWQPGPKNKQENDIIGSCKSIV